MVSMIEWCKKYETVSSNRYKLACAPIEDSDQLAHLWSHQSLRDALLVAKGPMFLQAAEN